ncbi:unnamed protein product [Allacma fusca]|uniref:Uncharacterized protein n=2 Tax=Allacma fusca TaxID=39272 RepID=A0A8J2LRB5_9HEXA|nr:unnamed protein product [Allacma fusca]
MWLSGALAKVGSSSSSCSSSMSMLLPSFLLIVHIYQVTATQAESLLPESIEASVVDLRDRGLKWLVTGRNSEFGWDLGDTPRVVLALSSSASQWPAQNDLEARLTVKQLELELLDKLLRHSVDPVTPARVSYFSLALNGACKDARNFYGHNLVASLEKHTADQDYPGYPEAFGFSLTALVSCLSGSHLHRRQVRHLIAIATDDEPVVDSIDTRSMAVMALECLRRKRHSETLVRHIGEALKKIARLQQPDGTFGNIHTTTVAVQAMALGSVVPGVEWNRTAAALALRTMQRPDGSFLDSVPATAEAVIAATTLLNGMGLLSLKRGRCSEGAESLKSTLSQPPLWTTYTVVQAQAPKSQLDTTTASSNNSPAPGALPQQSNSVVKLAGDTTMASVKYWIWIGPTPLTAQIYNISLSVPVNTTFFAVMRRAAELDPNFEFSSTVWPNGHYVHTISGHREQPIGYHYWLLYHLPTDPDPAAPPPTTFVAPAGVDKLLVQDRDVYLFWYKKL